MAVLVALLRGVNVGGRGMIAMATLRTLFEEQGLVPVKTLLQSGNVVFEAGRKKRAELVRTLEAAIEKAMGARITVILRNADELRDAIARNPFRDEANTAPSRLLFMFLDRTVERTAFAAFEASLTGSEKLALDGAELFLFYPEGIGQTKITGALIEKRLGVRGTGRNWRTVARLIEAAENLAG